MEPFQTTDRTRLRRLPERGKFDRQTVYSILDSGFLCHVGFISDGKPVVIPTAFGREGDRLYLHGSSASRHMRVLASGADVCLTVSHMDGLVLARSGFHSSINYRSVVVFGKAVPVEDPQQKLHALAVLFEHMLPGRWADVRETYDKELKITSVVALELNEVSAKIRTGGPVDDLEDYSLPVWAGVLPIETRFGEPLPDPQLPDGTRVPDYIRHRIGSPLGNLPTSNTEE